MISDRSMVAASAAMVVAVWTASTTIGVAALLVAVASAARRTGGARVLVFWCLVAVLVVGGAVRSERAWSGVQPDALGGFLGWAHVVDDPQPYDASTRVIVRLDGERFELWARGRAIRQRVATWRAGEQVMVSGERRALDDERSRRVAWQHVVGRFELEWASDVREGAPVAVASNRVRAALERASGTMPAEDAALYRGLVIGDDSDQPPDMIQRFRASGLSHLTAVSGQNIVLLLAACGPLLRRLGTAARWSVTVGLIGWFVILTRFGPSDCCS
jgi:competence protein ComEC